MLFHESLLEKSSVLRFLQLKCIVYGKDYALSDVGIRSKVIKWQKDELTSRKWYVTLKKIIALVLFLRKKLSL